MWCRLFIDSEETLERTCKKRLKTKTKMYPPWEIIKFSYFAF